MTDSIAAPLTGIRSLGAAASGAAGTPPSDGGAAGVPGVTSGGSAMPTGGSPSGVGSASSTDAQPDLAERTAPAQRAAESESLTEQGMHLCRTARWRVAIEPLRRATELDATNVAAFYYLGDAYNHVDALAAALEAFESAARLQPDHWRALKGVGIVLDRMRRPQEAAAAYQRARDAQSRTPAR